MAGLISGDQRNQPEAPDSGKHDMIIGALTFAGGQAITVATHSLTSGGESHVVAWAAMLFGGIRFMKGLTRHESQASPKHRQKAMPPPEPEEVQPVVRGLECRVEDSRGRQTIPLIVLLAIVAVVLWQATVAES